MKRLSILALALLLPALALAPTGCALLGHKAAARASTPTPDLRPPFDPTRAGKDVLFWQSRTRRNPQNGAIEYAMLAGAYMARARQTGDPADSKLAEQAARRSLAIRANNNAPARDQLAFSLFNQHQFGKAEALAAVTAAKYQDDPSARLCWGEAALERGDYAATRRALQTAVVAGQTQPDPSLQALQARMLELDGHPADSLRLLRTAQAEVNANSDAPRTTAAWFHMRVGDLLWHMGRADEAEKSFNEALAIYPQDYRTMTGLTRLAAGRQDWPDTIKWGQKAAEVLPNPEALALVGDAYAATGDSQEAERQYQLVDAFADPSQGILFDRLRALFLADHNRDLPEALARARAELSLRHDIYAYDTLAWALYKNNKLPEAQQAMQKALALHTEDAGLFYHAGMIALARGDRAGAKAYLSHALAVNPYFGPVGRGEARKALAGL